MARKNFRITQIKGLIGEPRSTRTKVRALGLRWIGHSVVRKDNANTRGMIKALAHFLTWDFTDEPVGSWGPVSAGAAVADFDVMSRAEQSSPTDVDIGGKTVDSKPKSAHRPGKKAATAKKTKQTEKRTATPKQEKGKMSPSTGRSRPSAKKAKS